MAKLRRRERHLQPQLVRERLGLLVEHQERDLAAAPTPHVVHDLLVAQQVVADLLDRRERPRRLLLRHEHVRVPPVEGVVVVDELEVAHPAVDAQQVERRRAHEVDGRLVRAEEVADRGDAAQRLASSWHVERGRGDHVHGYPASPHQSRMNMPRTCAVWITDGRYTRSPTPCAASAYGPKHTAGICGHVAEHRSVRGARGGDEGRRRSGLTSERSGERRDQLMIVGDLVPAAREAVVRAPLPIRAGRAWRRRRRPRSDLGAPPTSCPGRARSGTR